MIRPFFFILLISSVATASQQTTVTQAQTDLRQDTSTIYSELFDHFGAHKPTYFIESNPLSLQEDLSGNLGKTMFQQGHVAIPTERMAAWSEVLTELNTRKSSPEKLEAYLKFATPYVLVSAQEAQQIQGAAKSGVPLQEPKLRDARDIFKLGEVYFDQKRTLALTYLSSDSNLATVYPGWVIFEKDADAKWQLRSNWITFTLHVSGN